MTHTISLTTEEFDTLIAHYAHSLMIARDIRCDNSMSVNDFRNRNERTLNSIRQECFKAFGHELTYDQISAAIKIYFSSAR